MLFMPRPKGVPKTGGRSKGTPNKATAEIRAAAAKLCPAMLRILAKIARSEKTEEKVRVDAARHILEYGAGKPTEMHEYSGPNADPIPASIDIQERIRAITDRLLNRAEGIRIS